MFKLIKYIVKREYKVFILLMIPLLTLMAAKTYKLLPESNFLVSEKNYSFVLGLVAVVVLIALWERLGWYVEKGLVTECKEYFAMIPYTTNQVLIAITSVAYLELVVFSIGIEFITLFGGFSIKSFLTLTIVGLLTFTALSFSGIYVIMIISKHFKSMITGYVVLSVVICILIFIIGVSSMVSEVTLPFLYNYWVLYLAGGVLLTGIGYFGLCSGTTFSKKENSYKFVSVALVVLTFLVYGLGQFYSYSERRIDEIDMVFELDEAVVGEWHIHAIASETESLDEVSLDRTYEASLYKDAYHELTVTNNGEIQEGLKWTKGFIVNPELEVSQAYNIIQDEDEDYLVVEWKHKGYVFMNQYPKYYIYKRS